jgi:hypothetical protein
MALFWRLQGTTQLEMHPSWHGTVEVILDEPASPDWPGYWWAEIKNPHERGRWYLVREHDIERAHEGEPVDIYVPGLFGCDYPADLLGYIESQVGGVTEDDELYVALYEGDMVYHDVADDGIVFAPRHLLEVMPAHKWVKQLEEQLERA